MRTFLFYLLLFSCGPKQLLAAMGNNNDILTSVEAYDMAKFRSILLHLPVEYISINLENTKVSPATDLMIRGAFPIADNPFLDEEHPSFDDARLLQKAMLIYYNNKTADEFLRFLKVVKEIQERQDVSGTTYFKLENNEPMLLLQVILSAAMTSEMKLSEEGSKTFFELFNDPKLLIRDDYTNAILFPAIIKFLDTPADKQFVDAKYLMKNLLDKLTVNETFTEKSTRPYRWRILSKKYDDWMKDFVAAAYDFMSNKVDTNGDDLVDTVAAPLSSIKLFYATLAYKTDYSHPPWDIEVRNTKLNDKIYNELVTKHLEDTKFTGFANASDLSCLLVPTYGAERISLVIKTLSDSNILPSPVFKVTRKYSGWGDLVKVDDESNITGFNCETFLNTLTPYVETVINQSWLPFGIGDVEENVVVIPLNDGYLQRMLAVVLPSLTTKPSF